MPDSRFRHHCFTPNCKTFNGCKQPTRKLWHIGLHGIVRVCRPCYEKLRATGAGTTWNDEKPIPTDYEDVLSEELTRTGHAIRQQEDVRIFDGLLTRFMDIYIPRARVGIEVKGYRTKRQVLEEIERE